MSGGRSVNPSSSSFSFSPPCFCCCFPLLPPLDDPLDPMPSTSPSPSPSKVLDGSATCTILPARSTVTNCVSEGPDVDDSEAECCFPFKPSFDKSSFCRSAITSYNVFPFGLVSSEGRARGIDDASSSLIAGAVAAAAAARRCFRFLGNSILGLFSKVGIVQDNRRWIYIEPIVDGEATRENVEVVVEFEVLKRNETTQNATGVKPEFLRPPPHIQLQASMFCSTFELSQLRAIITHYSTFQIE